MVRLLIDPGGATRKALQLALLSVIATSMSLTPSIPAQQADSRHAADTEELAKRLSNPVADLVSIPIQLNQENGVGPVFGLPTSADTLLGSGKWPTGPTAVVAKQTERWALGALANHLWSIADMGDVERSDVSQTFLQPFLTYTTKRAVTFGINTESDCNRKAVGGRRWTVPINVSVSKVARLGPFPVLRTDRGLLPREVARRGTRLKAPPGVHGHPAEGRARLAVDTSVREGRVRGRAIRAGMLSHDSPCLRTPRTSAAVSDAEETDLETVGGPRPEGKRGSSAW